MTTFNFTHYRIARHTPHRSRPQVSSPPALSTTTSTKSACANNFMTALAAGSSRRFAIAAARPILL
jgi:hypothetical protein